MIRAERAPIPSTLNVVIASAVIAINLGYLLVLPFMIGDRWHYWCLAAVPFAILAIVHWALIHEAIHKHLHAAHGSNEALGRVLGIVFGAPFENLRFGHLSHHALNADAPDRWELYDASRISRVRAALAFYPRLFFGLYAAEFASGPLSLLPRRMLRPIVRAVFYEDAPNGAEMADRAERRLLASATLRKIRLDAVAAISLLLGSLWLYGTAWPVLASAFVGRAFVVSFMDNSPHYEGPVSEPLQGYDMQAPVPLQRLVLNGNYHGTHHRNPSVPWTALPQAFSESGGRFEGEYVLTPWRQLKGPVPVQRLKEPPVGARTVET